MLALDMTLDIGSGRFALVVRVKVPVSEIRFDCWCWKAWGQIPVLDTCHWSLLLLAWGLHLLVFRASDK